MKRALQLLALLCLWNALALFAQSRTVALTFDDLPYVGLQSLTTRDARDAMQANRKLLRALAHHHVSATSFVIQAQVEKLGMSGDRILRSWIQHGQDLGNHSYSHANFDDLTTEQFEDQVVRGESAILSLMRSAGRKVEFFRFPYNHTGDTEAKHQALATFLSNRGYRLAPCTIENSDWVFAEAYARMIANRDRSSAARLRREYLAFTAVQIDYFGRLNAHVLGYEPAEIMLLHDNKLNADVINELLALFEKQGYKWVSLSEAETDPIYKAPDTFVTKYGPMWGYRWARERRIKIDGYLEPDPPAWVSVYGKESPASPRRSRWSF